MSRSLRRSRPFDNRDPSDRDDKRREMARPEKDFGTVEVGKRANLVLVEGDPLKNIKDLRAIAVVIKDGRIVFRK